MASGEILLSMETQAAAKKNFQLEQRCQPAPVRVPSQRSLAPSATSVTTVDNDKGDNEMMRGAVHGSPGICLTCEENPRKPQLGDRLMKGLCGPLMFIAILHFCLWLLWSMCLPFRHTTVVSVFLQACCLSWVLTLSLDESTSLCTS